MTTPAVLDAREADDNVPNGAMPLAVLSYEMALQQNPRWALSEGSRHFDEQSALFQTLRGIAQRLDELQIPYAVVGGMALFRHGLRRFTEDVDILVTKADLRRIHEALDGRGYLPPFAKSKNLRDTQHGVRIEFLTTGDFPGDGKPKPVSFPDPASVSFEADGVRYINLETLVELKLASGMTNLGRLKDLSDVMELIKTLSLSREFSDSLNPYVREKYVELWQQSCRRYVMLWREKQRKSTHKSLDELIQWLLDTALEMDQAHQIPLSQRESVISNIRDGVRELEEMKHDGVVFDQDHPAAEHGIYLVTTDPLIAEKYGFIGEDEFWEHEEPVSDLLP